MPKKPPLPHTPDAPTRASRPLRASSTARPNGVKMKKAERERAQETFLRHFADNGIISAAAAVAGISRQTVYAWQEHDVAFTVRYHDAEERARDVIRAAIHQHAILGWDEPVVSMGKVVYVPDGGKDADGKPTYKPLMQHKYDSARLGQMAAARLPEYKQQVDVHATLDIQGAADEADRRWTRLIATLGTRLLLDESEREGES